MQWHAMQWHAMQWHAMQWHAMNDTECMTWNAMTCNAMKWSTLKSAVFSLSSSLPPLVSEGGRLVCQSDLLLDDFDSK